MNDTIVNVPHADFGMPVSGRARVASLRALPMTADAAGVAYSTTGQKCVVIDWAFSGPSAWSPPS